MIPLRRSAGATLPLSTNRSGATLTEVLMSLLIMSIGIVSVITMFPISVVRSIQATQLTNARLLALNAEHEIRVRHFSDPLAGPTGGGFVIPYDILNHHHTVPVTDVHGTDIADISNQSFRGEWQPNTPYWTGQIVTMPRKKGAFSGASQYWFVCGGNGVNAPADPVVSGLTEPTWITGIPMTPTVEANGVMWLGWFSPLASSNPSDGNYWRLLPATSYQPVIQESYQGTQVLPYCSTENYVVDPLGWASYHFNREGVFGGLPRDQWRLPQVFGYRYNVTTSLSTLPDQSPTFTPSPTAPLLRRLNGGARSVAQAEQMALLPDSWSADPGTIVPVNWNNPAGTGPTAVTIPPTIDLSNIIPLPPGFPDSSAGEARLVVSNMDSRESHVRRITAVNTTTNVITVDPPLPLGFVPDGPARIERKDLRYTWMATVNKDSSGKANVSVAVFFKRGFIPKEEHVYQAIYGDGNQDMIRINWDSSEPDPVIKAGSYLLDARYARWYRILSVDSGVNTALITVDRQIPTEHRSAVTGIGKAVLMRGIIELFEIKL